MLKPLFKCLLVPLCLNVGISCAMDASEIFKKVSPSVVVIKIPNAQGSGVATKVDRNGLTPFTYIISNCHVVNSEKSVTVERLGKSTTGKVLFCDAERDVALITIGGELPVVEERNAKIEIGEKVYAVGSPRGLELSLSEGVVSQLRPSDLGKDPIIQTTAAISPGSSGGGLFDQEGKLMGITTMMLKESQSLNFAMPSSFVRESITANKNKATTTQETKKCGWIPFQNALNTYIEPCSITPYRNYKSAWFLMDSEKPESTASGKSYLSSSTKWIVDCSTHTMALKSMVMHKEAMGMGKVVHRFSKGDDELKFDDDIPGTLGNFIIEYLCLP